jgi:hypothetical protein
LKDERQQLQPDAFDREAEPRSPAGRGSF